MLPIHQAHFHVEAVVPFPARFQTVWLSPTSLGIPVRRGGCQKPLHSSRARWINSWYVVSWVVATQPFEGGGGASAPPLSLPQVCILPYVLVPGLILVHFTTHQEPIRLKTTLFLRFLFCSKLTSLLQLTAQPHWH